MTPGRGAVLDASALLAYVHGEPGAQVVSHRLRNRSWISAVNWAEVLGKLAEAGQDPADVRRALAERSILGVLLFVRPFEEEDAEEVGRLRPLTRDAGLSLGARACLALGRRLDLPILTADRSWLGLDIGVTVESVR